MEEDKRRRGDTAFFPATNYRSIYEFAPYVPRLWRSNLSLPHPALPRWATLIPRRWRWIELAFDFYPSACLVVRGTFFGANITADTINGPECSRNNSAKCSYQSIKYANSYSDRKSTR